MHEPIYESSPEQHLWQNVILTLLHDLQRDVLKYEKATDSLKPVYKKNIDSIQRIASSEHLSFLCDMACVNHQVLIKTVNLIVDRKKKINIPRADFFRVPREFN